MLLRDEGDESTPRPSLLVAYAEHECEPRLASLPLHEVLADLQLS